MSFFLFTGRHKYRWR